MVTLINSWIGFFMTLAVLAVTIGIVGGIFFGIMAFTSKDLAVKRSAKRSMWWLFLAPFGFLISLIILYGCVIVYSNTASIPEW